MRPRDLLKTAELLLSAEKNRPTEAALRRAVSSCYYALFHFLARECADLLIGGRGAARSLEAWRQVYRALDHGEVRSKCKNTTILKKFPHAIQRFAGNFIELQKKRHDADYDPFARFAKDDVEQMILLAKEMMEKFRAVPVSDRRAFCAYLLFKTRS